MAEFRTPRQRIMHSLAASLEKLNVIRSESRLLEAQYRETKSGIDGRMEALERECAALREDLRTYDSKPRRRNKAKKKGR